ncbi:MAG: hypothetical protein ABMB14_20490 [Myxococcota bacterium]
MGAELAWLAIGWASACAPTSADDLARELAAAEGALVELDIPAFLARSDAIREEVPCLSEVPPVTVVARLHRVEGLRKFGERDVDAVRAFAAARALDPGYRLPDDLAPAGSPVAQDYLAMDVEAGSTRPVPSPRQGTLYIDGQATTDRPEAWPALVQLVDGRRVRWSVYRPQHAPLPTYDAVTPTPATRRAPLVVATAATAAATGVAYGFGRYTRATWADPDTPLDALPALRTRTNVLGIASVAGAVATVGLGAAAVVTW